MMIIGFIGFGEVSARFADLLKDNYTLISSSENRSKKTVDKLNKYNIKILDSFKEVAIKSDILISANSPKEALNVAKKYGPNCKGLYLDLNNISPETTYKIANYIKEDMFIDGAIIGKVNQKKPILYLSGKKSNLINFKDFNIKIISDNVGDVSKLKLLRSIYTKSVSAILIETLNIADNLNLKEELYYTLSLTEGENFKKQSESRIKNTKNNSKRKIEELKEILDYFSEDDLIMVKATLDKFNDL